MKQQKGITLIALVITIIVLLILAGVTIAMLSGDNSAPQKATEASQKDAITSIKDDIAMRITEALTNYYDDTYVDSTSGTSVSAPNPAEKVNEAVSNACTAATSTNKTITKATSTGSSRTAAAGGGFTDTEGTITIETKSYTQTGKFTPSGAVKWDALTTKTGN